MVAEGIILAKSLIPNLLRACAIVHWGSHKYHFWMEIKSEIHISEFCFFWSQNRFVPINFSKLSSYSSSTSALSANKVSSVCLSWSPVNPPSTPTCSPPAPPPPPSLSHSFANLSLLLLLLTHHKCTCTPFLLNVVPSKYFLRVGYQTWPLGSKISFLLWYRHFSKLLIQRLWAERITLWAFIIACQGHISCVIDIFGLLNSCLKFC